MRSHMPDDDQGTQYVRDALEGHLDEEIVAAQWFRAPGGFEGKGLGRVLRNVFKSGGGHPADRLGNMNVLALTPTRLIAFAGRTGWGGLQLKEPIAEWPAGQAKFEHRAERVTASTVRMGAPGYASTTQETRSDIVTIVVEVPGEERGLEMDLPDVPETHRLVDGLKAARR